jgi:hypothetical protein
VGGFFVGFSHPHGVLLSVKTIKSRSLQVELVSQHQNQMSYRVHGGF